MTLSRLLTVVACMIAGVVVLVGVRHFGQRGDSTVQTAREDSQPPPAPAVPAPSVAPSEIPRTSSAPPPDTKPEPSRTDVAPAARSAIPNPPPSAAPRPPRDVERSLSELQREKLTDLLDPALGEGETGTVALVTTTGDAEARRYADQIAGVLTDLGWRVFPGEVAGEFEGVRIRASSKATPAAKRLQQALVAAGIDVSAEFGTNVGDIQVFVGHRR